MKEDKRKWKCACGVRQMCEGICRELHLYRKRKKSNICPAAHD